MLWPHVCVSPPGQSGGDEKHAVRISWFGCRSPRATARTGYLSAGGYRCCVSVCPVTFAFRSEPKNPLQVSSLYTVTPPSPAYTVPTGRNCVTSDTGDTRHTSDSHERSDAHARAGTNTRAQGTRTRASTRTHRSRNATRSAARPRARTHTQQRMPLPVMARGASSLSPLSANPHRTPRCSAYCTPMPSSRPPRPPYPILWRRAQVSIVASALQGAHSSHAIAHLPPPRVLAHSGMSASH